jgi:hypothetical protein
MAGPHVQRRANDALVIRRFNVGDRDDLAVLRDLDLSALPLIRHR